MRYNHQFKMIWEKNVYLQPYSTAYHQYWYNGPEYQVPIILVGISTQYHPWSWTLGQYKVSAIYAFERDPMVYGLRI